MSTEQEDLARKEEAAIIAAYAAETGEDETDVYKLLKHYGHIGYDSGTKQASGCRAWVGTAEELNILFEDHANTPDPLLLVDWKPMPDGRLACLISGQMSEDKLELLQVFTSDFQAFRQERGAERRKLKAAAREAEMKLEEEKAKVFAAGKHCLEHHKSLDAKAERRAEKAAKRKGK